VADIDTAALKANFAEVAGHGPDVVAQYFYGYLFLRNPETRDMFPPSMAKQRDRLLGALVRIVTDVDNVGELVPYLEDLGRDHRCYQRPGRHGCQNPEIWRVSLEHVRVGVARLASGEQLGRGELTVSVRRSDLTPQPPLRRGEGVGG